jgi:NAD(P) transhydrogenase
VDENYRTAVPNVYAAGDVIGFPSLASTSMGQGRRAALHAFEQPITQGPERFPFGIWTLPEISTVGLTEAELTGKGIPYEVSIARFRETARGQIVGITEGLLKLLFHLEDKRLLGVHIIGEGATELIHIGQAVLCLDGTLDYFVYLARS